LLTDLHASSIRTGPLLKRIAGASFHPIMSDPALVPPSAP